MPEHAPQGERFWADLIADWIWAGADLEFHTASIFPDRTTRFSFFWRTID
jgi:hypothetical protein